MIGTSFSHETPINGAKARRGTRTNMEHRRASCSRILSIVFLSLLVMVLMPAAFLQRLLRRAEVTS